MAKRVETPKGFRDIGPELAAKRRSAVNKIVAVLEEFGFVPIETPSIEFAEVLKGKYGEEERLIYEFTDRGGRKLTLRYDLTVPLARYVATNNPPLPFRRYQIGQVFRGEKPQRGRWREFTQLDFDTVGSTDLAEDAKVIAAAIKAAKAAGLKDLVMIINDRGNFEGLIKDVIVALDKLDKVGKEGVIKELTDKGMAPEEAEKTLEAVKNKKPTQNLEKIFADLAEMGISDNELRFVPTLARGLNYYTGTIFELSIPSYNNLSIGGGGRYDNLIGMFGKKQIPAVGFSFGLDRLLEALE